jgi:hypothetical protein
MGRDLDNSTEAGHPIELLHSESAERPREAFHGNGRCGIDPFANGGGYTEAIAKSIAVRIPSITTVSHVK